MKNLNLIIIAFVLGILIYTILPKFCGCDKVLEGHGEDHNGAAPTDGDITADRNLLYHILNSIEYKDDGNYTKNDIPRLIDDIMSAECEAGGDKIFNQIGDSICSREEHYNTSGELANEHIQRSIITQLIRLDGHIKPGENDYDLSVIRLPFTPVVPGRQPPHSTPRALTGTVPGPYADENENDNWRSELVKVAKTANLLIEHHRLIATDRAPADTLYLKGTYESRIDLRNYYRGSERVEGAGTGPIFNILKDYNTIYPSPTDDQISAAARRDGMGAENMAAIQNYKNLDRGSISSPFIIDVLNCWDQRVRYGEGDACNDLCQTYATKVENGLPSYRNGVYFGQPGDITQICCHDGGMIYSERHTAYSGTCARGMGYAWAGGEQGNMEHGWPDS